jgi:hypothetical protein
MPFILKNNIKRPPLNDNFKNIIPKKLKNQGGLPHKKSHQSHHAHLVCDKDIYKMSYNMQTIKKGVARLFEIPNNAVVNFAGRRPTTTAGDFIA